MQLHLQFADKSTVSFRNEREIITSHTDSVSDEQIMFFICICEFEWSSGVCV